MVQKIVKKILLIVMLAVNCFGEKALKKLPDNVQVTADNMEYDTQKKHANASGNVRLSYEIGGKSVVLTSDYLQAKFDDDGKLIEAIAKNNVAIIYDGSCLSAEVCTHDFNSQQALCTGSDVKLTQDKNELHGNSATIDFAGQVFTMRADGRHQITSVIYPQKE